MITRTSRSGGGTTRVTPLDGDLEFVNCTDGLWGWTHNPNSGYSITHIHINHFCDWDWDGPPFTGKDAGWIGAHEVGHALGLNHLTTGDGLRQFMDKTFGCPVGFGYATKLADDDAKSLQNRYPGLPRKAHIGPVEAGYVP